VRRSGVAVWLTVTSSEEARAASTGGADALVVQGPEAGGHRGTWEDRDDGDVPLLELVEAIAAAESVPLIAAGGIADRKGVLAALAVGATAVQVGTAFLLCPEAGTGDAYRRAVAIGGETGVTRAFTGRRGRGLLNAFMRAHDAAPSAYPHVHQLTSPLRAAARSAGDANGFNLWAGTNVGLVRAEPAAEVVARLGA
jgi:nitronate monooxygenase